MFTETGRVVAVEPDSLWVEVIQTSACQSCQARKGCGQAALAKVFSARRQHVRAVLAAGDSAGRYAVNDRVEISIADSTILRGVGLVYVLPLLMLVGGALLGQHWFAPVEGQVALTALAGFALGIAGVRLWLSGHAGDPALYPEVKGPAPLAAGPAASAVQLSE